MGFNRSQAETAISQFKTVQLAIDSLLSSIGRSLLNFPKNYFAIKYGMNTQETNVHFQIDTREAK